MPMNSAQLAALVERAKQKPPPVVTPPPPKRVVRPAQTASRSPAPSTARPLATAPVKSTQAASKDRGKQLGAAPAVAVAPPPLPSPAPQPEPAAEPEDFPIGWELSKESWHFHRRFFRIFRRPMRRGEYSHLLWQIRRRKAEHLWEDCWRVKLPDGDRTLPVRATRWQLITILPKHWQPPTAA